jgi:hypothetical protein
MIVMKTIRTASYRGWDISVKQAEDGKIVADFGNEHRSYSTEGEDIVLADADSAISEAMGSIDMYDTFDPELRSSEFVDIEPPEFGSWLLGEDK